MVENVISILIAVAISVALCQLISLWQSWRTKKHIQEDIHDWMLRMDRDAGQYEPFNPDDYPTIDESEELRQALQNMLDELESSKHGKH